MTHAVAVTDNYVADFESFAGNGARGAPAWLHDLRARAIARFAALGFPSMRQEDWRFTNVAPIAERAFALSHARPASIAAGFVDALALAGAEATRLVIVNGRFAPELSRLHGLPQGVRAESLKTAFERAPDLARRHLAQYAQFENSAFAALNTAFLADGAFIYVPAGVTVERPIEILFVAVRGEEVAPTVSHARSLVVLERGARATVVEHFGGLRDDEYWTNAVSEIAIGDGAQLEYVRVQRESRAAFQMATTQSSQGRDSTLRLHAFALGSSLARHDVRTVLGGTGSELILNGFYLLRGTQHADHHTVIDHAEPHGTSHEFFNGIVGEQAHGVFSGRIIVRPGAQRTDSKQTNNNLLLSAEARADSQPQLEIYADDVKCTHGSTVGPLDETALYYLRSRGMSPETAAAMLIYGLGAEILDRVQHPELREALERIVRGRLADRQRGGRRGSA